jgi:hypothetical protein|nr:MAG TPA: hypothetical protein [Caudoviricetes sp.]
MRLIDADELKNVLVKHFDAYFNENGRLMYSDHICTSDDVSDLFNLIDKQPTAYDTDKVLEQLKNERKFWENAYDSDLGKEKARSYEHAIEIVKAGGKDE